MLLELAQVRHSREPVALCSTKSRGATVRIISQLYQSDYERYANNPRNDHSGDRAIGEVASVDDVGSALGCDGELTAFAVVICITDA
jgi:hypothetical protein